MPRIGELRPGQQLQDGRIVKEKSLASAAGRIVVRFENANAEGFDHEEVVELADDDN
jgi:hypothetical protein